MYKNQLEQVRAPRPAGLRNYVTAADRQPAKQIFSKFFSFATILASRTSPSGRSEKRIEQIDAEIRTNYA
jgi:hypothetical protein